MANPKMKRDENIQLSLNVFWKRIAKYDEWIEILNGEEE